MSQQAASSSRSDKLNFRVFIKASEADGVEVKVNATSATNISELRNWLSKHVDLDQVPSLFGGSSAAPWPFAEGGDVPNGAGTPRGRAPAAAPASAPL